ncbi:MAG TPA: hypothetical protein VI758_10870 [Bacteroidota bacterium]
MRKLLRITYYAGTTIVFLLVALLGYTQTRGFRNSLQTYILSHYHSVLNGTLSIGRIEGNLITGIRLYDVSLRNADSVTFSADRIELSHDPIALFLKRVSLGRVSVVNPHIQVYRRQNGEWNFSTLVVPTSDTSGPSWIILVKNLELVNARVSMTDSVLIDERAKGLRDTPPPGVVDYARVTLDSLNVEGGLQVLSAETKMQLRLLEFVLENPRIHLRHLEGDFDLAKNQVKVSRLRLVTDRSNLSLDASLSNVNIARLKNIYELKTKPVSLNLRADNLNTAELKQFLYPWVDFLDQTVALQVHANGEFGKLNVEKVVVETPKSMISVGGTITNLHRPKDLELDLVSTNSVIDPNDVIAHVPGLSLPALGELGRTNFRLTFKGTPSAFASTLKAQSELGGIDANAQITIGDLLEYKAAFVTTDLDLGGLFDNTDLNSRLNLNGTLSGIGTDIHSTSAVARIELDSSEFWGQPLGQSAFVFDLNNSVLRSHAQLRARTTTYDLSSTLRFPRGDSVSYILNGTVNGLNLAEILKSEQFGSDLSFGLQVSGRGSSMNRLHNSAVITFSQSKFGDVPFETGRLESTLNLLSDTRSVFALRSEPLDVDVDGNFGLPSFIENIIDGERCLSEAIAQRIQTLDSLKSVLGTPGIPVKFSLLPQRRPKFVDVSFNLSAKNLYPVGVFFQKKFAGSMSLSGTMKGNVDSLRFTGVSRVQSFAYRNQTDTYEFDNGMLSIDLKNISRTGPLDVLGAKLDVRGDKFSINDLSFFNTSLALESDHDTGSCQWSALVDSTYQVDLRATSEFSANVYTFEVSQLRVGMDFYIFENTEPVTMKLGKDALFIDDLVLAHEVEELGVKGYFSPAGSSNLSLTVSDFLLNDLKSVLMRTKFAGSVRDINGILNATLDFQGPFSDPEMKLDLTANGFRSRNVVFGQVVARSTYTNHVLSMFVELRNKQNQQGSKPDLLVSGTVPYVFGSKDEQLRTSDGEINLTLFSSGLNLEFLDPFIPAISNLSGTLICDMKIHGSVDAPSYEGSLTLQAARFMFNPLGINFIVHGRLVPNGTRVGLENFVVRNIPQDRNDSQMMLSGSFSLAGLKLEDFDLKADGQLLVMKESSRIAGQKFYGDLLLATGPGGVHWEGQLSGSRVGGNVLIKSGKIILPPDRETAFETGRTINVIFKDDTSKVESPRSDRGGVSEGGPAQPVQYASLGSIVDPRKPLSFGRNQRPEARNDEPDSRSFLDNIAYDLNIDVQSPTSLLFIFNTQPSEQLFADLKGKLAFFKNPSQTRLTGEVTLESRSYYYFFKRFEASGNINFTGDPINPELNVTAMYVGNHTLDTAKAVLNASGQLLSSERVDVLLHITGNKNKPKTKFSLEFPDRDKRSQYVSKDPDGDAMSFLLTGYLREELDPQQRGSFLTVNMLSSLTSGLITGPLTTALKRQISAIQSVDLQYYGGDWNKTDVRVTAEINTAVIRFGGRLIEGINNTNVSVEVPVGTVFGSDRWRNFLLKYERKVDAVESVDQRMQSNSLSLFYRIIF